MLAKRYQTIAQVRAANNGLPYSATELVKLFADIRCRADAAYKKATGEEA